MNRIIVFLACVSLISCQQTPTETTTEEISEVAMPAKSYYSTDSTAEAAPDEAIAVSSLNAPAQNPETVEQKIIRDARLRFETSDMEETNIKILGAAKKYGAQIQNDSETKEYNVVNRNLTIRIPNQHFEAFLSDVAKGVTYFDEKEISSTDVTEEFIDVDARLKAKKKLEARYLELLGKAGKVSEMIEIERQLAMVREEIESKEGRLRYMQNRVSQSTVNIQFYKTVASSANVGVSFGTKIWNAVKTGFNSISVFFVEVINNWPLILILVVLFLWLRRKLKKRKNT